MRGHGGVADAEEGIEHGQFLTTSMKSNASLRELNRKRRRMRSLSRTALDRLVLAALAQAAGTSAQQSNIKTAAKEAVVQAIVNRPSPGASRGTKKVAMNESMEPKESSMPLYYSVQRNVPPLPFNPYPELQLFDFGDNRFVYDDRDVDYVSLRKEREELVMAQTGAAENVNEAAESSNGLLQSLLSDGVRLHLTRTGSSSYSLLVTNLSPGTQYLLTDKLEFVDDLRAQWKPLFLFTAASNSATFTGTFAEDCQFFAVWDWDAYVGPAITLANPPERAVLTGKIKVKGSAGDIFPDRVAELYVDGDLVVAITNGPIAMDLDTQLFSNGVHTLEVVVRTDQLTTNFLEFATVESRTVTFSNFLASIDNGPFFSFGAVTLNFSTTGAADYTLEVLDDAPTVQRTFQGTTAGGAFQIAWDGRNSGGSLLPIESAYTFKMTAVGTGGGAGATAKAGSVVVYPSGGTR